MPAYGEAEYWDHRYQAEPVFFDWYLSFQGLGEVLQRHVPVDAHILQVGVGTSLLQAQMVEQAGYQNILSVDISSVAIKHMQQVHSHIPQLEYRVADCRSLPQFSDGSFDAILDKGTLDSLMCGEHAGDSSMQMLEECHRLLKDDGVLINVTYGEPSARVPLLQRLHFHVSFYMLSKDAGSGPAAAVPAGGSTQGDIQVQRPMDALSQPSLEVFPHSPTTYYVYVATKPHRAAAAAAAATPSASAGSRLSGTSSTTQQQ